MLLEQLGHDAVKWGHQLVDFKETEDGTVDLTFEVNGEVNAKADLVVGADGIRGSSVRKLLIETT
jgi:2-polyprenyl-6-methoxyphenol hydroxylase-like FAD-dependent oxidoreductase